MNHTPLQYILSNSQRLYKWVEFAGKSLTNIRYLHISTILFSILGLVSRINLYNIVYYFDSHVLALKSSLFTPYGVFNELLLNSMGGLYGKYTVYRAGIECQTLCIQAFCSIHLAIQET